LRSVQQEHAFFERSRGKLKLDAVISDQRSGIRSKALPSVLITHQVFPFTPIAQSVLRKLNLRTIARFDRCWIMDEEASPGLAGELSHGTVMPGNSRYIGTQSRMAAMANSPSEGSQNNYRIVAVISGPEPQRSLLEGLLIQHMQRISGEHLLVCGLPDEKACGKIKNVTRIGHMQSGDLANAMLNSEMIVSRSGYTTLMDLAALGRSALIIPTPGQGEQMYLGTLHGASDRFIVQQQDSIDLPTALRRNAEQRPPPPVAATDLLNEAFRDLAGLMK